MAELEIRYTEDGDIESYDPETGKTVGHVSTMGNMIEQFDDDKRHEWTEEEIKKKIEEVYSQITR